MNKRIFDQTTCVAFPGSSGGGVFLKRDDPRYVGMLVRGAGEGFLISIFNPKIALFFLAIYSHVVSSESDRVEIVLMGSTAAIIDALWYVSVSFMLTGSSVRKILVDKGRTVSQISGFFLVGIAIYLTGGMLVEIL